MKKLFSCAALYALLYAMPACANFLFGEVFSRTYIKGGYLIGRFLAIFIALFIGVLLIEAFLLWLALENTSYMQTLKAIAVGNIPSLIIGATIPYVSDNIWNFYPAFLLLIIMFVCNTLLMIKIIGFLFRYPAKQLILPLFIGNLIAFCVGIFPMLEITGFH